MNRETPPEKLIFVDNFVKGFLSFGLLGSFFGILIYSISKSLWVTAKFNLLLWIITSLLAYFRGYASALKCVAEEPGKPCAEAEREAGSIAKTFALEWAVLLPLSSVFGAVLFSITYPNILLGILLAIASSTTWGYIHAKIFTPAYIPIANQKKVLWISKIVYQKGYGRG